MGLSRRSVLSGMLATGAACTGAPATQLTQKAVTDPGAYWNTWGNLKANYVADKDVEGGAAQRLTILSQSPDPWSTGGMVPVTKAVRKDDVLLLTFWARANSMPAGRSLVMLQAHFFERLNIAVTTPNQTVIIGAKWKPCFLSSRIERDYAADQLAAAIMLGTAEQTIDFGRITVFDFGPNTSLYSLPRR